jgi:ATP-dependent protease ClpP protease subunit
MSAVSDIINREKPDTIYCLFSSTGGVVDGAITLYNFLRALPVEIIMHNTGSVDSAANIIFLAADTRYASKHSSFLFHGTSQPFIANTRFTKNQIAETLSSLNVLESKMIGVMTDRTKLTTEEIKSLFSQGEPKYPDFALDKGIISEIKDPKIPPGIPILSFNLPA